MGGIPAPWSKGARAYQKLDFGEDDLQAALGREEDGLLFVRVEHFVLLEYFFLRVKLLLQLEDVLLEHGLVRAFELPEPLAT